MRISYQRIEDITISNDATVLVPCVPDTPISSILEDLGNTTPGYQRIMKDFEELSGDDTMSVFTQDTRIELVHIKTTDYPAICKAMQGFAAKFRKKQSPGWVLYAHHLGTPALLEGAITGLLFGLYEPGLFKSENNSTAPSGLTVISSLTNAKEIGRRASDTADTQKEILRLVNTPANHKEPQVLADWAKASGNKYGYNVHIFDEEILQEKGFHGLLAVNRGSEHPARFIICDYHPEGAEKTVALVGKGVTFDTGGVSIKPANHMHYMKSDMSGAAAVLGAVELAAKQQVSARVIGFVPATDNSVDARAIKPGDVISSFSGQTIEVINTDAEGRLILADALAYAIVEYKPDVVIDLATLTGSVVRALGNQCAGLFTHNDDLARTLTAAGERIGERLWRMPLWDVYAEEMRSDIADIKNLSEKPLAGSITAAKFLEHFVDKHPAWAHIDIAGTAFKGNGTSRNYTATAYGVRLLLEFLLQE